MADYLALKDYYNHLANAFSTVPLDPRALSMPGGLAPREAAAPYTPGVKTFLWGYDPSDPTSQRSIFNPEAQPGRALQGFERGLENLSGLEPGETGAPGPLYDWAMNLFGSQETYSPEEPKKSAFQDLFLTAPEGEEQPSGVGLALGGTGEATSKSIPIGEQAPVKGFDFSSESSVTPEMQARWDKAFEPIADETEDGVLDRLADFFAGAAAGSLQGEGLGAVLAGAGAGGLKALSDRKERKRLRDLTIKRINKGADQKKALVEMEQALNRDHLTLQQNLAEATDRRQQEQLNQQLIRLQMPRYFASGTSIIETRYDKNTNSIQVREMPDQLGRLLRLSQIGANQSRIKSPYEGKFVPDKFPPVPQDRTQQPGHIAAVSIMRDNADPELLAVARQEATRQLREEGVNEYDQGFEKTLARRTFDVLRQAAMDPNAPDEYKERLRAVFFRNVLGSSFGQ